MTFYVSLKWRVSKKSSKVVNVWCIGADLSVCEAWSRGSRRSRDQAGRGSPVSCCTRQMEARLSTHARRELSRLLTGQLDDVRHDFSNANGQFESTSHGVRSTCLLWMRPSLSLPHCALHRVRPSVRMSAP